MRAAHAVALAGVLDEGEPEAAEGGRAFENRARDLGRHFAEAIEILADVLDVTDVDLQQPRADGGGVDQQADVDAVIVLEAQLEQEFLADGDDAAQRLFEVRDFREVGAQQRPRGEDGDAAGASREAGFDEVGFPTEHGFREAFDEVVAQAGKIAIEVEQRVMPRFEHAILHGGSFAEQRACDHAAAGRFRNLRSAVDRAVVHHDDFAHERAAFDVADDGGDAGGFVQHGNHHGDALVVRPCRPFRLFRGLVSDETKPTSCRGLGNGNSPCANSGPAVCFPFPRHEVCHLAVSCKNGSTLDRPVSKFFSRHGSR